MVPRKLAMLGLPSAALARHIGWDIGIHALGRSLATRIDAAFVHQPHSRLVIDCNRDPHAVDSIPACSDGTDVPGNIGIDDDARRARIAEIHTPYHAGIEAELARRRSTGEATIIVALHSFTPRMSDMDRPWHIGLLHAGRSDGFSRGLLAALRGQHGLVVGDNEPYRMDETDYSIPRHAFANGLAYAEIEIRQDLLETPDAIARWADMLAMCMHEAAAPGYG